MIVSLQNPLLGTKVFVEQNLWNYISFAYQSLFFLSRTLSISAPISCQLSIPWSHRWKAIGATNLEGFKFYEKFISAAIGSAQLGNWKLRSRLRLPTWGGFTILRLSWIRRDTLIADGETVISRRFDCLARFLSTLLEAERWANRDTTCFGNTWGADFRRQLWLHD